MRENNRKSIARIGKLPQFTTMNVIDGQAVQGLYASLIFYSLTIDNILNIIVLLILAGVALNTLIGQNSIVENANKAVEQYNNKVKEEKKALEDMAKHLLEDEDVKSEWNGSVQTPYLMKGMTAVYWSTDGGLTASTTQEGAEPIYERIDENGNASSIGNKNSAFKWENWYNYVAGDNSTDTKTSRWANAVTDDGSYWVWIPRFKYRLSEQPTTAGKTNAGKTEVIFIPTTERTGASGYTTVANSDGEKLTTDSNGYIIHPAFEDGSSRGKNNGYANGEWDSELAGFWVAKYEMSREDSSNNGETWSQTTSEGNVATSTTIRMVSKPNVSSWRTIQVGQIYQNCIKYDTSKNSHLIKNSEWGAVAYLTHSQYGRNRNEVTINNNKNFITGIAGDSVTAGESESTTNAYNTTKGMLASTTGNIYGVYDMSGGAWERVAIWDTASSHSNLTDYGKAVDGTVYFAKNGTSDRTKTAYSNGTDTYYGETVKNVCRTGDGVKETWVSGDRSWFNDYSYFVGPGSPFAARGGCYNGGGRAGVFCSDNTNGHAYSFHSFRVVLAGGV